MSSRRRREASGTNALNANGGSSTGGGPGSGTGAGSSSSSYLQPFSTAVSQSLSSTHASSGSQYESTRLLADLAPHIMKPRILAAATNASSHVTSAVSSNALVGFLPIPLSFKGQGFSLVQPARNLVRIGNAIRHGPVTSNDLLALESSHQILADAALSMTAGYADEEEHVALRAIEGKKGEPSSPSQISLLRGFEATIPSATLGRERRRKERAREGPRMGLKTMGDRARGLLTDVGDDSLDDASSANAAFVDREKRKEQRSQLRAKHKDVPLKEGDLLRQESEVKREKEDIDIRRRLLQKEIATVDVKIAELQAVKDGLTGNLLGLKEEELELDDEASGIAEMLSLQRHRQGMPGAAGKVAAAAHKQQRVVTTPASSSDSTLSSRRRKGPMFLPSEHDELPSGVAFMTLAGHTAPISSLDFSEPYGALVTAGGEGDATVRVWDLSSGTQVGLLRHDAVVKALQVEDELCVTGGADAKIKIWDLRKVEDWETRLEMKANGEWSDEPQVSRDDGERGGDREGTRSRESSTTTAAADSERDPRLSALEGHSKEVTALYFDETCLVSGANDKTLRQWDLNTGQCVLTMDILWAISNPSASQALGEYSPPAAPASPDLPSFSSTDSFGTPSRRHGGGGGGSNMARSAVSDWSGNFSFPTPAAADGSWELYTDFVGSSAIQFWGYALASGSADGAVRMWDMRTGQSHRTLLGHTAPVTCLQFDETHVISGSLDKSVRIWDLRTGGISETIKYEHGVTALQFDSRKIVAATGENGVDIYNRTTLQHSTLNVNGHMKPVERLRYMDRYAVSGGKDAVVKVWAL
ncbi:WD40 repeat-like protein [Jaminaea rosea]|uniref:WD40 repeat-like protein n=1 Tax=Jaminaea rosea TaxID=1569628 RepID=A0A316UKC0_9BASI|nr:WD40 repeat-like protein [Jaminaea rosea]PWN25670.1 WD40 repeat-like protein [Jaminaea rosea]